MTFAKYFIDNGWQEKTVKRFSREELSYSKVFTSPIGDFIFHTKFGTNGGFDLIFTITKEGGDISCEQSFYTPQDLMDFISLFQLTPKGE